eukprot:4407465-Pleurochrysis_carterae.AAC.1
MKLSLSTLLHSRKLALTSRRPRMQQSRLLKPIGLRLPGASCRIAKLNSMSPSKHAVRSSRPLLM